MQNIREIKYPPDQFEVIIIDSASTDGTVDVVKTSLENLDYAFQIRILEEETREGKARALNRALKYSKSPIIAISDADAYLEPDALLLAIRYLADETVGAVTGREKFLNLQQNLLTQSEGFYRTNFYNKIRTGESKRHSTLIFQGELSIFKRSVFNEFTVKGSDDSGTVKNIIAKEYRTLFIPEVVFYDVAPDNWRKWITVKSRRSLHLLWVIVDTIKLKIKGEFPQPGLIVYSNFFIHFINPVLGLIAIIGGIYLLILYPILLAPIILLLMVKRLRGIIFYYVLSEIAMIYSIYRYLKRDHSSVWKKWRN